MRARFQGQTLGHLRVVQALFIVIAFGSALACDSANGKDSGTSWLLSAALFVGWLIVSNISNSGGGDGGGCGGCGG